MSLPEKQPDSGEAAEPNDGPTSAPRTGSAQPELRDDEEPAKLDARAALRRAERARASAESLLRGRPRNARVDLASAHLLLREALYWTALGARRFRDQAAEPSSIPFSEAWTALSSLEPSKLPNGVGEAVLSSARLAFVERSLFDARGLPVAELKAETEALRQISKAWLLGLGSQLPGAQRRRGFRTLRRLLIAAIVIGNFILIGANWEQITKGRNLALHKPVTTSSVYGELKDARGAVDGILDQVGFHTWPDYNPWVQVDLESIETISEVEVFNRTDCCARRAVPLSVLISTDGKSYQEVAHRDKVFDVWKATFPKTPARFVKLVLRRREWFHLAEIRVR